MSTYKAVQVTEPGKLQLVELPIREPGRGQVRLRVEACGVCHSDSGTVEGLFPISWPRVPGHEVVGRIDALDSGVQGWAQSKLALGTFDQHGIVMRSIAHSANFRRRF